MPEPIFVHPDDRRDGQAIGSAMHVAERFGAHVDAYDAFRPRYAAEAVASVAERGHKAVLDVGCGTGILSMQLLELGVGVVGVEPDARMASVARAKGIPVDIASFESWDPAGRQFDAVVRGQAWHWIDPERGHHQLGRVLRPDGDVFLLWNVGAMDADTLVSMSDVYRRRELEHLDAYSVLLGRGETSRFDEYRDRLETDPAFLSVTRSTWTWRHEYAIEDWLSHLLTHPEHGALDDGERRLLFDLLRESVELNHAGRVVMEYTMLVLEARLGVPHPRSA